MVFRDVLIEAVGSELAHNNKVYTYSVKLSQPCSGNRSPMETLDKLSDVALNAIKKNVIT